MRNRDLRELILALTAGPDRAAVIYGDLLELKPERGTLWFWGAYLRTLAICGWKIPVALLAAIAVRELVFDLFHLYIAVTPPSWRSPGAPFLLGHTGPLVACIMSTLWFVLPYSVVAYGVQDRVVRLTFAISVGTTIAFLFVPWLSFMVAVLTAMVAMAALASSAWRSSTVILLTMLAIGVLMLAASGAGAMFLQAHNLASPSAAMHLRNVGFESSLLMLAIVYSWLHQGWGKRGAAAF